MEWTDAFWNLILENKTFSMFIAILSIVLPIIWRVHDKKLSKENNRAMKEELNEMEGRIKGNIEKYFRKQYNNIRHLIFPKTVDDWLNDAQKAVDRNEYGKAIKCFRRALKIEPEVSVFNSLGLVYKQKGDYGNAIKCFEEGIKLCSEDSGNAVMYFNMGLAYTGKREFEEAADCLKKVLAFKDVGGEVKEIATLSLGIVYSELSNYPKVIEYLVVFINQYGSSAPENIARAYYVLGEAYCAIMNYSDSRECFLQAIKSGINHADTLFYIGYILAYMGDYENAIECFDKALAAGYDSDMVYLYLGVVYSRWGIGDADQHVKECFKKITGIYKVPRCLSPNELYANLGYAYYMIDEYDKSIEYSQKAIDSGGGSAFIYCYLGLAYEGKGVCVSSIFYDSAMLYLRKAIELDPDCSRAYYGLGLALLKKGLFVTEDSVMGLKYIQYAEKLGLSTAREFLEDNRELFLKVSRFDAGECLGGRYEIIYDLQASPENNEYS